MATDVAWYRVGGGNYTTIQAAVNAALSATPPGGVVYAPRGVHSINQKITVPFEVNPTAELTLRGDGANATIVRALTGFVDFLEILRGKVVVEGMAFSGPNEDPGFDATGIRISGGVSDIVIRDCIVRWSGGHGLMIVPGVGSPRRILVERCVIARPDAQGIDSLVFVGDGARDVEFRDCLVHFFRNRTGVELYRCEDVSFYNTTIDPSIGGGPFIVAQNAVNCRVIDGWFEEPSSATTTNWMIDLGPGCRGWTIFGNYFVRQATADATLKILRMGDCASPAGGMAVINPHVRVTNGVTPIRDDVQILNAASEACFIGGAYDVRFDPNFMLPMEILDQSNRSVRINPWTSRPPRVDDSDPPPPSPAKFGDLVSRPRRGIESWRTSPNAWVPVGVPRFPSDKSLEVLPADFRSLGTIVWVDNPAPGTKNLRAWNGTAWKGINIV